MLYSNAIFKYYKFRTESQVTVMRACICGALVCASGSVLRALSIFTQSS